MNNTMVKTHIIQNEGTSSINFNECKIDGELLDLSGVNFWEAISSREKIINISIQAQPGLKFYINDNSNPIIIGSNGIFSWEIKTPNTYIYSLKIKKIEEDWPEINSLSNIIITYEYIIE